MGLILSWLEIAANETLQKETILIQIHSISRVAWTQDNIFLWQMMAQLVSKLIGIKHRKPVFSMDYLTVWFGLYMLCSH